MPRRPKTERAALKDVAERLAKLIDRAQAWETIAAKDADANVRQRAFYVAGALEHAQIVVNQARAAVTPPTDAKVGTNPNG